MQNEKEQPARTHLSEVWQELLGTGAKDAEDIEIPTLESDPWSALLQSKDVELIDLQQVRLHVSDQDVERVLEIIREQPDPDQPDKAL